MFILAGCEIGGVEIPPMITNIISYIVTGIKIGVPIILVIFGMIDLGKAVMSSKEDDIKKAQSTFIKRLMAAALVFFVITIVQFLVGILDNAGERDGQTTGAVTCLKEIF